MDVDYNLQSDLSRWRSSTVVIPTLLFDVLAMSVLPPYGRCAVLLFFAVAITVIPTGIIVAAERPNVVIVIADDQGYGDLGCTGNPIIQTPNIDTLARESSTLSDYHVAPTCSPTRSALLTGHWTNRTGVWHTINGRSMLRADEVTIGQIFHDDGYRTGMFGKWHLGDNYPYRAEDRGFDEVYRHGGGGVGQTPDYWNNSYFDGSYFHNGNVEPAEGFCTDVFFEKANDFIRDSAARQVPFLAYISTNAPHGPLHCKPEDMQKYAGQPDRIAAFFGMITNIDENVGRTREMLDELGIADNTIFVFTTDNGTASGDDVFNASMRGKKGSPYEGGHRVPFMMHWPAGGMDQAHVSDTLCHAVDVVPTLIDLCGVASPDAVKFDGVSIRDLLTASRDESVAATTSWNERILVTDSQRVRDPIKWRQSSVMQSKWRLINGTELYDIQSDPGQQTSIHGEHPEKVAELRAFYEDWWAELEPTFARTTEIVIGHPDHPRVELTAHDWIQEALPPWNQGQIREGGLPRRRGKQPVAASTHQGHWAVKFERDGRYQFTLRRWPEVAATGITDSLPAEPNVPGADLAFRARPGVALDVDHAELIIDGQTVGQKPISEATDSVSFTAKVTAGSHQLSPVFSGKIGTIGTFYCTVERVGG
ncbi:arylsulfatase [Neorhodopirellula pilleata]|uniref:Arylsulfatase n=1 Tax=Neorhodopirellula pilleata TaxID=2714738 RepID=A0A5C6A309_9BACT|nr:arylsulfatase [Neorhodopirellula pilleata]TWT93571.1 Arylsulfatase precursor [Neorhodopirellula pilleata]